MGLTKEEVERFQRAKHIPEFFSEIRDYVDPLDAEFINSFTAVVSEPDEDGYPVRKVIKFDEDTGEPTTNHDELKASDDQIAAIKAVWPKVKEKIGGHTPVEEIVNPPTPLANKLRKMKDQPELVRLHIYRRGGLIYMLRFREITFHGKTFSTWSCWNGEWKASEPPGDLPLYNEDELADAENIMIVEGEKAVDEVKRLRAIAADPDANEADKAELAAHPLRDLIPEFVPTTWANGTNALDHTDWGGVSKKKTRRIVLVPDNDAPGAAVAFKLARVLAKSKAKKEKIRWPVGVPDKYDLADPVPKIDWPSIPDMLVPLTDVSDMKGRKSGLILNDFVFHRPDSTFILKITGEAWKAESLAEQFPRIPLFTFDGVPWTDEKGDQIFTKGPSWLRKNRGVDGKTWSPKFGPLIPDRLVSNGGYFDKPGCTMLNLYEPSQIKLGDPEKAQPWLELIEHNYGHEKYYEHMLDWMAHTVQFPGVKINHALGLFGLPGVGKDTILEGLVEAVGPHNCGEIGPEKAMGRFNKPFKNVFTRISENRDNKVDPYAFYDHMKTLIAAPPFVIYIDEKGKNEYYADNVVRLAYTGNNRTNGIYLPADDRRHFPVWSRATKEDDFFKDDYFKKYWHWFYEEEGRNHIAAWLHARDLSNFNPKAPPPLTETFWAIVDGWRPSTQDDFSDVLDYLGSPEAVTIPQMKAVAPMEVGKDFVAWIEKNPRTVGHRLDAVGYVSIRNEGTKDNRWKVNKLNCVVYVKKELTTVPEKIGAAQRLAADPDTLNDWAQKRIAEAVARKKAEEAALAAKKMEASK